MDNISLIKLSAQGNWPYILSQNGIPENFLRNKHQPCPMCGGKNRFRMDDREGRGTYFCNNCGAGDGFKFLQCFHKCSFREAVKMVSNTLRFNHSLAVHSKNDFNKVTTKSFSLSEEEMIKRKNKLLSVWREAKPISANDPVDRYLKARGINLNSSPTALRCHPQLPYYEDKRLMGKFPAMLGLVTDCDGKAITIHRTYLGDGCKANVSSPKKLMPPIKSISGASIKLFEPIKGEIAVLEGAESALSFFIGADIPVWSTISAGGMEQVVFPKSVTSVIVGADNDVAGRKAASNLSRRLISEGRKAKIVMPPKSGTDFADVLMEASL